MLRELSFSRTGIDDKCVKVCLCLVTDCVMHSIDTQISYYLWRCVNERWRCVENHNVLTLTLAQCEASKSFKLTAPIDASLYDQLWLVLNVRSSNNNKNAVPIYRMESERDLDALRNYVRPCRNNAFSGIQCRLVSA